jgi:hypothetical protein
MEPLSLLEVVLDVLCLPKQEGSLLLGHLNEFAKGLGHLLKFISKFFMFLVLPGVSQ